MKIESEQNVYHANNYCLRGFLVCVSMKVDCFFLVFIFLLISACENERVSNEPLVSTREVNVSNNFSFYYLPRVISVSNESLVFLYIESSCLSVYSR